MTTYTDAEVVELLTRYGFGDKVFAAYDVASKIPRRIFHGLWGERDDSTSAWLGTLERLARNGLVVAVDKPRSNAKWFRVAEHVNAP